MRLEELPIPPPLMIPPTELGVLCLGFFVGGLLGYGLTKSGQGLKAVLTALGAALGGGPILFMQGLGAERWAYPIGLLLGLLSLRVLGARAEISRSKNFNKTAKLFAWIDVIVISTVIVGAVVYAFL